MQNLKEHPHCFATFFLALESMTLFSKIAVLCSCVDFVCICCWHAPCFFISSLYRVIILKCSLPSQVAPTFLFTIIGPASMFLHAFLAHTRLCQHILNRIYLYRHPAQNKLFRRGCLFSGASVRSLVASGHVFGVRASI